TALGRVARERAELRTGRVPRSADELFSGAKNAEQPRRRREAFERLADLDFTARHDPASALLWHRSIFEDQPDYKPSLRYLEQHLVGEGRDEELEPIASGIAIALRGTGSPESVAHAELAARPRMRGPAGVWESTREIVEVAAAEQEPSLWALRMLQSHAHTGGAPPKPASRWREAASSPSARSQPGTTPGASGKTMRLPRSTGA